VRGVPYEHGTFPTTSGAPALPFCKEVLISREPQMLYGRL
jgi:hypothetical protein